MIYQKATAFYFSKQKNRNTNTSIPLDSQDLDKHKYTKDLWVVHNSQERGNTGLTSELDMSDSVQRVGRPDFEYSRREVARGAMEAGAGAVAVRVHGVAVRRTALA